MWDLLETFLALEIIRKTNIFENRILFKQFSITKQEYGRYTNLTNPFIVCNRKFLFF